MNRNSDGTSTGMAIIFTIGILSGSTYTYTSDSTSSYGKKTYSSGSSSSKKNQSSMDSYDEGYEAIYIDDDYDWEC